MTQSGNLKKKILVVEDEAVLAHMCARVLELNGFEAEVVNNGLTAKDSVDAKHYDICVSDIRLPGLSGIQLYEYWKSTQNPIADKTIFITGDTMNNVVLDFLSKSDRPCIMKPFHPNELVKVVRETLA
jgi:DNA-binding response OmpR family regulator